MSDPLTTQFFNVTTTRDIIDPNDGLLSLREAIGLANLVRLSDNVQINLASQATNKIESSSFQQVPGSGVFIDTDFNSLYDANYGDFDIRRSMTIVGNGAIIDAQGLDRTFDIRSDS